MASVLTPEKRASSLVLGGDREPGRVQFEGEMVGFFVGAAELLGVPKSVAAIYGIIFASPEPLSFADIEARVDFSKGSVSQGLRLLREMGAIQEVSTDADRVERFVPDTEMRKLIQRFLEQRLEKQLEQGSARLTALKQAVDGFSAAEQSVMTQRVEKLQAWHGRTRALLPVVRAFLKLTKI